MGGLVGLSMYFICTWLHWLTSPNVPLSTLTSVVPSPQQLLFFHWPELTRLSLTQDKRSLIDLRRIKKASESSLSSVLSLNHFWLSRDRNLSSNFLSPFLLAPCVTDQRPSFLLSFPACYSLVPTLKPSLATWTPSTLSKHRTHSMLCPSLSCGVSGHFYRLVINYNSYNSKQICSYILY